MAANFCSFGGELLPCQCSTKFCKHGGEALPCTCHKKKSIPRSCNKKLFSRVFAPEPKVEEITKVLKNLEINPRKALSLLGEIKEMGNKVNFDHQKGPSLREMQGCLVEIALDRFGSKFLFYKLGKATRRQIESAYDEMQDDLNSLAMNSWAHVIIEPLFKGMSFDFVGSLLSKLDIPDLMVHHIGNRVLRKMIPLLAPTQKDVFLSYIRGNVREMSTDTYASFVLEKVIVHVSPHQLTWLVDEIIPHALELCTHQCASGIIQKIIKIFPMFLSKDLIRLLQKNVIDLMINPLGTWVVQELIGKGENDAAFVLAMASNDITRVCLTESGCFSVNKALRRSSPWERRVFITKCFEGDTLELLAQHPYGFTVIGQMVHMGATDLSSRILSRLRLRPILGQSTSTQMDLEE